MAGFLFLTTPTNTSTSINQRISSLKRNTKSIRNVKKSSSTDVELCYYNKKEYQGLYHEKRKELAEIRGQVDKENRDKKTSMIRMLSQHYSNR